jgi:hypothetical protein
MAGMVSEEFGWRGRFEDIPSFDLTVAFDLDPSQLSWLMEKAHEPHAILGYEAVPGAADGMRALALAGFEIVVVTGRPPRTHDASREWLDRRQIPCHRLVFVDKYGRNHRPAGAVECMTLPELTAAPFRLAVEDAPAMLQFLARETAWPLILFDRPWNRSALPGKPLLRSDITRCHDWREVVDRILFVRGQHRMARS